MENILFEWDDEKAEANIKKHGISFDEATTSFKDYNAIVFDDPEHSEDEDRFILLGFSSKANLLIVCHCYREADTMIRIVSARKATKEESKIYEEGF